MDSTVVKLSQRLADLGYKLPPLAAPLASYVPAKAWGELVFVSGQLPLKEGSLLMEGTMHKKRSMEQAQEAMAHCFLNGLAAAARVRELDKLRGVLRLGAYVASAVDFTEQHLVANGASDLAQSLFGSEGLHVRFAVGVSSLPKNATVELEIVFYV